jgi:exopolyphosphatase/pppGpp-phosphohydrolase
MRLGVLDVGSNTVHLLVVDAYPGARPLPAFSHKVELSLAAHLERDNTLSKVGEERLTEVVEESLRMAEDKGVEDFLAFATSAVRDAVNGDDVLARIQERTGARIQVLSGENEARLTFLAARRWFGWSSGRLLVVDIGGGSLEIATGLDEEPEAVMSLPLGAGRLTRDWFTTDPPSSGEVRALRRHVRAQIARMACAAAAPSITRSARRRPSGSSPGSPGRRRRARASTSSGSSSTATSASGRSGSPRWTGPNACGSPESPRAGRPRCWPAPSSRTR